MMHAVMSYNMYGHAWVSPACSRHIAIVKQIAVITGWLAQDEELAPALHLLQMMWNKDYQASCQAPVHTITAYHPTQLPCCEYRPH